MAAPHPCLTLSIEDVIGVGVSGAVVPASVAALAAGVAPGIPALSADESAVTGVPALSSDVTAVRGVPALSANHSPSVSALASDLS